VELQPVEESVASGSGDNGGDSDGQEGFGDIEEGVPLLPPPAASPPLPRGALHALPPPPGGAHALPAPPAPPASAAAPAPASQPPQRLALDRRHVARTIVRAALTSDLAVGCSGALRVAQALLALAVLSRSRSESCDNGDLLRVWLFVYAARCVALARLLYTRHRLYRPGARAREGGAPHLARSRLRAEHAKSRLDSLGTVWFVMGALWLFGSADCPASAPLLTRLTAGYLLLGFASLFVPILFFGLLCCALPPVLAFLNAYGAALGLRSGAAGGAAADDAHAWIAALPCHAFAPAPPPDGEDPAAASSSAAPPLPPRAASPTGSAAGGAASDAGSSDDDAPARGGFVGKRYVAAEDASCVICLGSYPAGGAVRELPPCGHHFHASCLDTWLRINASCPLCKASVGPRRAGADGEEDEAAAREAYLRAAVRGGDDLLSVLV
jgi:hypothetical protein